MSGYPCIVVPSLTLVALDAFVHLRHAVADPGIEVGATAGVGVRAGVRAGQPREAHHAGQRRRRHRREQEDEDDDQEVVVGDEVEVGEGDEGHGGHEGARRPPPGFRFRRENRLLLSAFSSFSSSCFFSVCLVSALSRGCVGRRSEGGQKGGGRKGRRRRRRLLSSLDPGEREEMDTLHKRRERIYPLWREERDEKDIYRK